MWYASYIHLGFIVVGEITEYDALTDEFKTIAGIRHPSSFGFFDPFNPANKRGLKEDQFEIFSNPVEPFAFSNIVQLYEFVRINFDVDEPRGVKVNLSALECFQIEGRIVPVLPK